MHDDEITSDELDDLLDTVETLRVGRPAEGTKVRLYVAVDADTLHELEQRGRWDRPQRPRRPTRCEPVPTRLDCPRAAKLGGAVALATWAASA